MKKLIIFWKTNANAAPFAPYLRFNKYITGNEIKKIVAEEKDINFILPRLRNITPFKEYID